MQTLHNLDLLVALRKTICVALPLVRKKCPKAFARL